MTGVVLLLLSFALSDNRAARVDLRVGQKPLELATLTYAEAQRLDGKVGNFRVAINSPAWEHKPYLLYEAGDQNDPRFARTAWQRRDAKNPDAVTVRGRLSIIRHPQTFGADGTVFTAFIEFRVVEMP